MGRASRTPPSAVLWYENEENMKIMPTKWDKQGNEIIRWEFHPIHIFLFSITVN